LALVSQNNTDTYGFWESPVFALGSEMIPAAQTGPGNSAAQSALSEDGPLFIATFRVNSSSQDRARAPVVRLRSSCESFERSAVLVATSRDSGTFSPVADGVTYRQYFQFPADWTRLRLDFDMMNFDPRDEAVTTFTLESATIQALDAELAGVPIEELAMDFTGPDATHGWTFRSGGPLFGEPISEATSEGLLLRGIAPTEGEPDKSIAELLATTNFFGYWGSPETGPESEVVLKSGHLYRVTFTVASDAPDAGRDGVPTFRLRLNETGLRAAAYLNVESVNGGGAIVPTVGNPKTYSVYFEAPPSADGERLLFSFDYLHVARGTNNPEIGLWLRRLEVVSFPPRG
jgi:hypothetical protein